MLKILRRSQLRLIVLFFCLVFIFGTALVVSRHPKLIEESRSGFVFTAAGDYGANSSTAKNLRNISKQAPDLHFVLGDLSYGDISPELEWCKFMNKYLSGIPILLVAGNHESDGRDGLIEKFVSCLPNPVQGVAGEYSKEYYFDYPEEEPLVRFIMISPDLKFADGRTYTYGDSSEHFKWLKKVVEEGQAKKISWTVVGMHKNCISAGDKGCEVGEELINYLLSHNVDLILQGHAHSYQRTEQLKCIKANIFDATCVSSKAGEYQQGSGGIISIVGTGGAPARRIDFSDSETPYFASLIGETYGFSKFEVRKSEIRGTFHSLSGIKDNFIITR